ncbi:MAG: TM2 domain-containing protein [Chitinophagales bacterium]|nr:TM2 domain-containing protein [Chitinophagales bacterium]
MSDIATQLDFATLALKGRRYQEAENIYMNLAVTQKSSEAWLGIGLCKLYQLSSGKTMEEVLFCFNKAIEISPELKNELEDQLMSHSVIVLNAYIKVIEAAVIKHQAAKKEAMAGALLASISVVAGMNSNKTFGTIASLAGTGAGAGVAMDGLNSMSDTKSQIQYVISKCDEIKGGVVSFVNQSRTEFSTFAGNIASIKGAIEKSLVMISPTTASNPNRKKASGVAKYLMLNASTSDRIKLIQAYFGIHKFKEGNAVMGVIYLFTLGGYGVLAYLDSVKMVNGEYQGHSLID